MAQDAYDEIRRRLYRLEDELTALTRLVEETLPRRPVQPRTGVVRFINPTSSELPSLVEGLKRLANESDLSKKTWKPRFTEALLEEGRKVRARYVQKALRASEGELPRLREEMRVEMNRLVLHT
jgi:hypothetical protein